MRALAAEMLVDERLATDYAERLEEPMRELKRRRLRSAQDVGQLAADLDLDIAIDLVWGPLRNRWLYREGPITAAYTDRLIETVLTGATPCPRDA